MVSKGTSPYAQAPRDRRRDEAKEAVRRGGLFSGCAAPFPAAPPQLRCCSRAIDPAGHRIMPGPAEHMPFSSGRGLSLSRINSSNYASPPREPNSEPFLLLSGGCTCGSAVGVGPHNQEAGRRCRSSAPAGWCRQHFCCACPRLTHTLQR